MLRRVVIYLKNFRFIFLFVLKMDNSDWNCPLIAPRAMMGIDSCGMLLSAIHEEEGEEKLHLLMVDDHIPAGAKLY